jgi:hypothetical protein
MKAPRYCRCCGTVLKKHEYHYFCDRAWCRVAQRTWAFCLNRWQNKKWRLAHPEALQQIHHRHYLKRRQRFFQEVNPD